ACGNAAESPQAPAPAPEWGEAAPWTACARPLPHLFSPLRINIALNAFLAHSASSRRKIAPCPHGRQLAEVRELSAEREGGDALALVHEVRGALARPHPHQQVNVIRLDPQRQYPPPTLNTFRLNEFPAPRGHRPCQHGLTPFGAPDQVVDDPVDAMRVALVV